MAARSPNEASFAGPQEEFWAGNFGDDYLSRNESADRVASNFEFFSRILRRAGQVGSMIELGANVGTNMRPLRALVPGADLAAVEISGAAAMRLGDIPRLEVFNESLQGFKAKRTYEFSSLRAC